MHVYIYDYYVTQKKYARTMADVETRLTDLGLNGKIIRIGVNQNIFSLVESELNRGIKTIIAVGNDFTIHKIINIMAGSKVPLGIIPIGKDNNKIAQSLGIEMNVLACNTISSRRIEILNLGQVNKNYFLTKSSIDSSGSTIEIDKDYSIEIKDRGEIEIINLAFKDDKIPENINVSPCDEKLELVIKTIGGKKFLSSKEYNHSIMPFKKLIIYNDNLKVLADNAGEIECPAEITISKKKINIIVGKDRNF